MAWRNSARWCGAALTVLSVSVAGLARPASAQEIERTIAGIRLGARATTVLAKYGNPNQVVIGDIGVRQAPPSSNPPGGSSGFGQPGAPGGSLPGMPGGAGFPGDMEKGGGRGGFPGMAGFPGGGGVSPNGSPMGPGSPFNGVPGAGSGPDDNGGGGPIGGSSSFGQTISPLAREQEVTWVYNRKVANNVVSYEFLIGPAGDVSQIVVTGYNGGNARTKKGIILGSTYKDVVRVYGYPEEHQQVGDVLIASYKNRGHVSFQFLNQAGQTNPYSSGNKVVAITIATVE